MAVRRGLRWAEQKSEVESESGVDARMMRLRFDERERVSEVCVESTPPFPAFSIEVEP